MVKGNLDSLSDYVDSFLDTILRSKSDYMGQMAVEGLVGMLPKAGGGGFLTGIANFFSGLGGGSKVAPPQVTGLGGRASGGPVAGGAGYIVGEKGPEVFVPGKSGNIISSQDLRGGNKVEIIINNNTGAQTTQSTTQGSDGIDRVIIDIGAADVMNGGNLALAMESTYGMKRIGRT